MKFKLVTLFFIGLFIISCNNDDDGGFTQSEENFQGTYSVTTLRTNDVSSTTFEGETITNFYTTTGSDFDLTWTFLENNTFTIVGTYTLTEAFEEDGESGTFTDNVALNESGTYILNLDNNTIILSVDSDEEDDNEVYEIITFTQDVVEFESSSTFTSEGVSGESLIEIRLERN